jgi:hypothetical protein
VRSRRAGLIALVGLIAVLPGPVARAQTVPATDVRRSPLEAQNAVGYLAEGVALRLSRGVVGAILVFPRGVVPPGWRSS